MSIASGDWAGIITAIAGFVTVIGGIATNIIMTLKQNKELRAQNVRADMHANDIRSDIAVATNAVAAVTGVNRILKMPPDQQ
jgi:hypothetical protein